MAWDDDDLYPDPDKFTPEETAERAKFYREIAAEDAAWREAERQRIAALPKREQWPFDPSASERPARSTYEWLQRRGGE